MGQPSKWYSQHRGAANKIRQPTRKKLAVKNLCSFFIAALGRNFFMVQYAVMQPRNMFIYFSKYLPVLILLCLISFMNVAVFLLNILTCFDR